MTMDPSSCEASDGEEFCAELADKTGFNIECVDGTEPAARPRSVSLKRICCAMAASTSLCRRVNSARASSTKACCFDATPRADSTRVRRSFATFSNRSNSVKLLSSSSSGTFPSTAPSSSSSGVRCKARNYKSRTAKHKEGSTNRQNLNKIKHSYRCTVNTHRAAV
jgi:hypothetical protein